MQNACEIKESVKHLPQDKMQYGWICPKCERVYAPFISSCLNCELAWTLSFSTDAANISQTSTTVSNTGTVEVSH